ncbi:MAG: hypothetical protein FWD66_01070 [Paludibacter sp.]|nr:hypothetical protein [Paludibacter sp.]
MEQVEQILESELTELENDIKSRIKTYYATGRTEKSLSHKVSGFSGILEGATYIETLERGRPPARGGDSKGAFLANLKEWIRVRWKDVKDEKDLERKAKFLKWYINKYGNKKFRNGEKDDVLSKPIADFTEQISQRISDLYLIQITNNLNL